MWSTMSVRLRTAVGLTVLALLFGTAVGYILIEKPGAPPPAVTLTLVMDDHGKVRADPLPLVVADRNGWVDIRVKAPRSQLGQVVSVDLRTEYGTSEQVPYEVTVLDPLLNIADTPTIFAEKQLRLAPGLYAVKDPLTNACRGFFQIVLAGATVPSVVPDARDCTLS